MYSLIIKNSLCLKQIGRQTCHIRFHVSKLTPKQYAPITSKTLNTGASTVASPQIASITITPDTLTPSLIILDKDASKTKRISKKEVEPLWQATPVHDSSKLINHYLMLSKIRLTSLVVITTMAGYAMAPAPFELSTFVLCSIGTGLVSASANAMNQFHEVPFDAQMSRTKNRVIVKGLVSPIHAVGFALGASATGLSILYFGVNGLTAMLGAANLLLYTSIYTPMKRYSILNTWVGSVVGAIPPVMGWVGCSGTFDSGAWILAGLLYAWQFPHFNALSWNLRPDYSRAGYCMMAVTNPALCRRVALRYTVVLSGLSILAPLLDVTNIWFAAETLPLNGYFIYLAYKFYKQSDSSSSRKLFRYSLIHLPLLMLLFLINKKYWLFKQNNNNNNELTNNNEKEEFIDTKTILPIINNKNNNLLTINDQENKL